MTLTAKFKKDVQTLRGAASGEFYLDVKNPKLFKKVRRYYAVSYTHLTLPTKA